MGKNPFSFRRTISRRRNHRQSSAEMMPLTSADAVAASISPPQTENSVVVNAKGKKKTGGWRLWMRFDRDGSSELMEWDKGAVIRRVGIPARDLRILGPVFSQSSNILAREKAMVVNLEFIKAIVTAEEVLLLDPLRQEVLPFVDQLRRQLSHKSNFHGPGHHDVHDNEAHSPTGGHWATGAEHGEADRHELPFEFQVLEIALEVVCSFLDSSVVELEKNAYPVLDELARNVSTKNLERVRSLKSNLTRLLAHVQKVRDEIEHLLDDNEDMAHLYLTRKMIQFQQSELLLGAAASNAIVPVPHHLRRMSSYKSGSLVTSNYADYDDVEDLEMLLEAYFMQLDGTRNKILSYYNIHPEGRLLLEAMHLDTPAATWYQGLVANKQLPDWDAFEKAIWCRFGSSEYEGATTLRTKLSQTGTVLDYQVVFEDLASKVSRLSPAHLESLFISRLQPRIPMAVQAH